MRAIGQEKRWTFRFRCKHGCDSGDVRQMGSAAEGIVQHRHVAGTEIQGRSRGAYRQGHRAKMHRHVIAHGDGLAFCVVDGAGIIAALFDVYGVGAAPQHHAHLLGDGNQEMAEQFQIDGIHGRAGRVSFAISRADRETSQRFPSGQGATFHPIGVLVGDRAPVGAVLPGGFLSLLANLNRADRWIPSRSRFHRRWSSGTIRIAWSGPANDPPPAGHDWPNRTQNCWIAPSEGSSKAGTCATSGLRSR